MSQRDQKKRLLSQHKTTQMLGPSQSPHVGLFFNSRDDNCGRSRGVAKNSGISFFPYLP